MLTAKGVVLFQVMFLGVIWKKKAMKPPQHISEIIEFILTDLEAMSKKTNYATRYHKDVTDLMPKSVTDKKKIHLKRGLDYDIDENGNVWMNPNVKNIGISFSDL